MSKKNWFLETSNIDYLSSIEIISEKVMEISKMPFFIKENNSSSIPDEILDEMDEPIDLKLCHNNYCVTIDKVGKKIYVDDFFFQTLVGKIRWEFNIYLFYIKIYLENKFTDFQIDIYQHYKKIQASRKEEMSSEEMKILGFAQKISNSNTLAISFLNKINYPQETQKSILEKKIIRDIIGTEYAKKLLGLADDAYKYMETGIRPDDNFYTDSLKKHFQFKEAIAPLKEDFESYISNGLSKKKIIIWNWWTISPFVAADLSMLLPMLTEAVSIEQVYIDLSLSSEEIINQYIKKKNIDESTLEKEIKKIYPPILKDFQKETLPYIILLEKLQSLSIPIKCFGLDGLELIEKDPILNSDKKLFYPMDNLWKKVLFKEYQQLNHKADNKVTIFFMFLKPMFFIPKNINDERIEKIIHVDRFTGFGPDKPENSLAHYSHHTQGHQNSFAVKNIKELFFAPENIVYFPHKEDLEMPALDSTYFNQFSIFDTMLYSGYNEGRGNKELSPQDKPKIHQPSH